MAETGTQPPAILDQSVDHADDVKAIQAVVADIETGLNTNDPDLMTQHFADNTGPFEENADFVASVFVVSCRAHA